MTQIYYIKGMHCASCELVIEEEVLKIDGVKFADASMGDATLKIEYEGNKPSIGFLNRLFEDKGYEFSEHSFKNESIDWKSNIVPVVIALAAIGLFLLLSKFGFSSYMNIGSNSSLAAFFVFGIIAGASTCAALVGGLILSLSKQWSQSYSKGDSFIERSKPHILFNLGRLVSYALVGGALGLLGAKLKISVTLTSIIVVIVSVVMLVLALQMLGIRWFNRFKIAMPKSLSSKVSGSKDVNNRYTPFIVGFLTFLLPCGFTLAAEGLAVLSGSLIAGSLIMFFFALGTAIPLLAIGLFSANLIASPKTSEKFLKIAGILVIFFVLYNLNLQFGLIGPDNSSVVQPVGQIDKNINQSAQVIKTVYTAGNDISPSVFTVKVGQAVRFEVDVQDDAYGCMNTIMVPKLWNYPQRLIKGETVVMEFTPLKTGTYQITCAMGVPRGSIIVTQ